MFIRRFLPAMLCPVLLSTMSLARAAEELPAAEEMPVVEDVAIVYFDDQPAAVLNAQRCLINLGLLKGSADGACGPKTVAAIKSFQQQSDLPETGRLDDDTYALLMQASSPDYTISEIQRQLIDLGYLYGTVNGQYDARTVEALTILQKMNGLPVTGTADAATLSLLFGGTADPLPTALFVGCRGEKVATMQASLARYGFYFTKANGEYDKDTANAVLSFQKHLVKQGIEDGIAPTGTATSLTLYHLYRPDYSSYLEDVAVGSTGREAKRIERRLRVLGYMDTRADETFDEYAGKALLLFQQQAGLPQSGTADRETVDALFAPDAPVADHCVLHAIASGDSGVVVREVERVLLDYGLTYDMPDGKYDSADEAALALLRDDGLFSNPARLSLEAVEALLSGAPLEIPTDAARVHRRLYSLCYLRRKEQDDQTVAQALREFQRANGLPETGEADRETLARLFTKEAAAKPYPYRVEVSLAEQKVTVYGLNDQGKYEVVRSFLCSTGLKDSTPRGIFLDGFPANRWHYFKKFDCWAQYSFDIEGDIMFHSVLYYKQDESTLKNASVWALGTPASHGCIRLTVEDAQWLYEHCPKGSLAIVIE